MALRGIHQLNSLQATETDLSIRFTSQEGPERLCFMLLFVSHRELQRNQISVIEPGAFKQPCRSGAIGRNKQ